MPWTLPCLGPGTLPGPSVHAEASPQQASQTRPAGPGAPLSRRWGRHLPSGWIGTHAVPRPVHQHELGLQSPWPPCRQLSGVTSELGSCCQWAGLGVSTNRSPCGKEGGRGCRWPSWGRTVPPPVSLKGPPRGLLLPAAPPALPHLTLRGQGPFEAHGSCMFLTCLSLPSSLPLPSCLRCSSCSLCLSPAPQLLLPLLCQVSACPRAFALAVPLPGRKAQSLRDFNSPRIIQSHTVVQGLPVPFYILLF